MKRWTKIALGLGFGSLALAPLAWRGVRRPADSLRRLTRLRLVTAGLRRRTAPAPRGTTVVWEGDFRPALEKREPGRGETLVLLHGIGMDAGNWSRVAGSLGRARRLLVPDLAGHGGSGPKAGDLVLLDLVQAVEALLDDRLGSDDGPVVLIGNSLGGWVSLLVAQRRPDLVDRLILVGSAGLSFDFPEELLLPEDREGVRRLVRALGIFPGDRVPLPGFVLDDVVREAREGPIGRLIDSFQDTEERERHLLDDRLGAIDVPAELVWGLRDGLVPVEVGTRLAAGLPRARMHVLEHCGHMPQVSCAGTFTDLVDDLLTTSPLP